MFFEPIESLTKLCLLKMRNMAPLINDHSSFTHIQTLHSPFTKEQYDQDEIIFHGLSLTTQDLTSTKGNYSEDGWSLLEPGRFLGAPEH